MSLNRYDARRDANEPEIIKAIEKIGAKVYRQSKPFDLLVLYNGEFVTLEVKDGKKPKSAQKLTEVELEFMEICREMLVPHFIVTNAEQAVHILLERRGRRH